MRTLYLILITGLFGCGAQEQPKLEAANIEGTAESTSKTSYISYGSKIKAEGAQKIEELNTKMQGKDTLLIKLEALIKETCSKKGCWMTVDIGGEDDMMVRFADYGFFVPTDGQKGKTAIFEGKAFRETVDVETLKHYAEDAGKSQEEINQITESEITIAFIAEGVIIKE